jgi:hypothetical protein
MEGGGFNFADYPVIVGIDFGKDLVETTNIGT